MRENTAIPNEIRNVHTFIIAENFHQSAGTSAEPSRKTALEEVKGHLTEECCDKDGEGRILSGINWRG